MNLGGVGVNVTGLGLDTGCPSRHAQLRNRRRLSVTSLLSARVHTVCAGLADKTELNSEK
jgi:hypothetical protein